jgi:hypothetical protein
MAGMVLVGENTRIVPADADDLATIRLDRCHGVKVIPESRPFFVSLLCQRLTVFARRNRIELSWRTGECGS